MENGPPVGTLEMNMQFSGLKRVHLDDEDNLNKSYQTDSQSSEEAMHSESKVESCQVTGPRSSESLS